MIRNALLALLMGLLLVACSEDKAADGGTSTVETGGMVCNLTSLTECPNIGCVNLQTDPANCGACGNPCGTGQACSFGECSSCPAGVLDCGAGCSIDGQTDEMNCGGCGIQCGAGQSCQAGACVCDGNTELCAVVGGFACVPVMSDPANCGGCGTQCGVGEVCSGGVCGSSCAGTETNCSNFCVDTQTDAGNCGMCGNACATGQACSAGSCSCPSGEQICGGQCVNTRMSPLHCGGCDIACPAGGMCAVVGGLAQCECPPGQMDCNGICQASCDAAPTPGDPDPGAGGGGNTPTPNGEGGMTGMTPVDAPEGRTCPVYEGLIADFEEASAGVLELEGRVGLWEGYNDGAGTQMTEIVDEGADECNKGVLHTTGSGFSGYVGVGSVISGTYDATEEEYVPSPYDAMALGYTGISFRAKAGAGQQHPVRFSLTTPQTVGDANSDGSCEDAADVDNSCWNHMGHFLIDDEALTTEWQTYTFCFDRDLYPMWLPTHLTVEQRNNVGANMLNMQFQFNQGFDPATTDQHPLNASFDFYVDDIRFTKDACPTDIFASTGSASDAFGTNAAVGSCMPLAGAEKFNTAISQAYARWKKSFVVQDTVGSKVISPEQDGITTSEGIGYGMLIAAAMGDQETFDAIWAWASDKMQGGLLGWRNGNDGSATDADTDMAYALFMAAEQWGGQYGSLGSDLAGKAASADLNGGQLKPGEGWSEPFNPSYFSPGFYRAFGGAWTGAITTNYPILNACDEGFTSADGIVPDWCSFSGQPSGPAGAAVVSEVCDGGAPCSAYDASRVPWRIAYDVCKGGTEGGAFLDRLVQTFNSKYPRIDLLEAGFNQDGNSTMNSVNNEMAFIGTVGTAAQAAGNSAMAARAMRTVLDIMERPEYYKTYYSASLGLMTLLMMTGNWPAP